jgi:hypothetical protein
VRWNGTDTVLESSRQPPNQKIRFSPFKHNQPTCIASIQTPQHLARHFLGPPPRPPCPGETSPLPSIYLESHMCDHRPAVIVYDFLAVTRGGKETWRT